MTVTLICPTCRNAHEALTGARNPHYCSIGCYRTGYGLDDPITGDGRRWCPSCRREFPVTGTDHCCDGNGVAERPPRPSSPSHRREPPSRHDGVTMTCPVCETRFIPTGRQRYCRDACRSAAYRSRRGAHTPPVAVAKAQPRRPITVYECDSCGERVVGEQRCDTCGTFMRRVGIGGCCPSCDEPIAVQELLDAEVTTG